MQAIILQPLAEAPLKKTFALEVLVWSRGRLQVVIVQILASSSFFLVQTYSSLGKYVFFFSKEMERN